ncbi:MAG TPA: amidase [Burkholderiales bacterium]|nr:amidase [Burkholderiales bacterium]
MSALARVRGYLEKIDTLNPRLGAFVEIDTDGALAAARASDGVALAIKDNIDVAGLHASAGMQALKRRVATRDAACIERLRAQGAIFLGKTLMDEAALGALGDNPWFGRCHNPARRGFTAGGSSSGSAAAVAAGLCAAALGTDTLGSVRIPASYCGVVGYLPGRGMIDARGVVPLMPELDRVGVLAPGVADAVQVANAMSEHEIVIGEVSRVTIGLLCGIDAFVAPEVTAASEEAARRLARSGHRIVEVSGTALEWGALRRAALLLTEREGARVHAGLLDDASSAISPALRAALEYGRRALPERVALARERVQTAIRGLHEMLSRCDLLLLPTTPQTAFAFDAPVPDTQADLTAPASVAGLAAISLPAGESGGLPIGVQLVGADDALLLGVAARMV